VHHTFPDASILLQVSISFVTAAMKWATVSRNCASKSALKGSFSQPLTATYVEAARQLKAQG
jgi:hypothetical protein